MRGNMDLDKGVTKLMFSLCLTVGQVQFQDCKMNRLVLSILILATLAAGLHYEDHEWEIHQVSDEDYYRGLIDLEKKLIDSMVKVRLQVGNMSVKIKTEGSTTTTETNTFKSLLDEEYKALKNLEEYVKVPLPAKPCNISSQTTKNRDDLKKEVDSLNSSVQDLKKQLGACSKCAISTDLNNGILQQENYVGVTNEICASNCTKAPSPLAPQTPSGLVDLSQSQYKNNLDAKNWFYGNITEDQYKYQIFADSIKYNQTSCPLSKPYVNPVSNNCFQCPTGLNFSLGEKTCKSCPNNFTYNISKNTCDSPCNSTQVYNTTSKKCQPIPLHPTDSICPLDKPIWNKDTKSCQVCPESSPVFNKTTHQCEPCPTNTTWNQSTKECSVSCKAGQTFNSISKKCVKPSCAEGTTWNEATHKCEIQCAIGLTFNTLTKKCQNSTQRCDDVKPIWNSTSLQCQLCPESTPVWNKTLQKCDPCPAQTPVFDYSLLKCVDKICDEGFKWNRQLKKCVSKVGNCTKEQIYVFQNSTCVTKCQANHTYFKENDTCSCTPELPYFNQTTRQCQAPPCPINTKWNTNLKNCTLLNVNCSDSSQFYNFTAGKCQERCQPGITYVKANDSCLCPPEHPLFNSTTRRCLDGLCSSDQKWNIYLKKCSPLSKNCSAWEVYDFNNQKCLAKCEVNHTYINETDSCQCTAEYPRFDPETRTCQKPICPIGYVWNKELIKCSEVKKHCNSWEIYDFKTENCLVKCEVNQTYIEKYDNCTCPPERPFYNSTHKNCTEPTCPKGYKFNPLLISCLSVNGSCDKSQAYNFTTGECIQKCENNQTFFPENGTCSCPKDRPFFNSTSKNCTIPPCPNNTKWNNKLLRCVLLDNSTCLKWQSWSFDEAKCIDKCAANFTYFKETGTCSCPPETPEYDNATKKCVQPRCANGSLWNRDLIKCSEIKKNCSAWTTYNFTTEKCDPRCEVNVTYDRRNDVCLCPPEKPHFDNKTRICLVPNCSQGSKYNPHLVKCSSILGNCSAWQAYNFTTENCSARCQINHTYIKEDDSCSCTVQKPLFDNKTRKCVDAICPNGTKWNIDLIKCSPTSKNCSSWENYNFTTETCDVKCQVNHTYIPSNNTCQCSPDAPYFNTTTRKCTIPPCPNGTQWNTHLKKCSPLSKNCSLWELYNFTTEKCDVKCKVNQQYHPSTQTCQCSPQFPLFDHNTQECKEPVCPDGYKWNKFLYKCSPTTKACLINEYYDFASEKCIARCEDKHTYFPQNDSCQCFEDKPFFNKTSRLCQLPVCPADSLWNPHLKKCSHQTGSCQRWEIYNFTNETCIKKCDMYQTYFRVNDSCSCYPADPIFNKVTRKCEEPICLYGQFWDRVHTRCRCKDGFQFNSTTKICQIKCPDGQFLNFQTNICQVIPPICGANMFVNASNICECLNGYVYEEGGQSCRIKCSEGFRYNAATKMCQQITCPAGFTFNTATQKCERTQVCPSGYFFDSVTNKCIGCPSGFVYNAVKRLCQASTANVCPQGYTFNQVTKLCDPPVEHTCSTGLWYDGFTNTCLPLYITSPQAANLISSNMTAYNEYYTNQKKSNSRLTDCTSPTPYYDKVGVKCVSCPTDHPYFNIDLNKCESCGTQTYDSSSYKCINKVVTKHYDVNPTIGRFMSNII